MIHVVHRGLGGQYTNYAKESAKRISRWRSTSISNTALSKASYRVAIHGSGESISDAAIQEVLDHSSVTFYVGDSNGLPKDIVDSADRTFSLAHIQITHQLEVCVLLDSIERLIKAQ